MGEKKKWKEEASKQTGARPIIKNKKIDSPEEDPRGQHFSRHMVSES
jgi:hypothetical protein